MTETPLEDTISWEDLIYLADFLEASGERRFPILGGEPTLHPDFNNMLIYLLERNFCINVFTSGIISNEKLNEAFSLFKETHPERLTFICNLNDPQKTPSSLAEIECIKRFLGLFGDRIIAGFNIYRTDFELDFLFNYIIEFGLQRTIRIGLAHPIFGKKNIFITLKDIKLIIDRLFTYKHLFERFRVRPGLDCGFPMCLFTDEDLGWLYRHAGGKCDFGCSPVIDVGPDMTVWPCFPLSSFHRKSIFEFKSLREIFDNYQKLHDMVRTEVGGIFEECDNCKFREERLCRGGCLAHCLNQLRNEHPVRLKGIYE